MSFIEREADLATAVMAALSFAGAAIVEAKVEGSEVAAGFVGEPPEALPLVEIVPKGGLYDYAARYTAGATEYFAPARLDDATSHAVTEVALAALTALHLRDVTRVDTIVDRDGIPWVLEVNVAPGMTDTSLLPMAAQVAGWSMADLCDRVVQAAARRTT
jgi:D-alanine-D-alanine ligase